MLNQIESKSPSVGSALRPHWSKYRLVTGGDETEQHIEQDRKNKLIVLDIDFRAKKQINLKYWF